MLHWLSEHRVVFSDIALVWIAPVVLVRIAAKVFQKMQRRDKEHAAFVALPSDDRVTDKERSQTAA